MQSRCFCRNVGRFGPYGACSFLFTSFEVLVAKRLYSTTRIIVIWSSYALLIASTLYTNTVNVERSRARKDTITVMFEPFNEFCTLSNWAIPVVITVFLLNEY